MNYLEEALGQIETLKRMCIRQAETCDGNLVPCTKANAEGRAQAYEVAAQILKQLIEMENRDIDAMLVSEA